MRLSSRANISTSRKSPSRRLARRGANRTLLRLKLPRIRRKTKLPKKGSPRQLARCTTAHPVRTRNSQPSLPITPRTSGARAPRLRLRSEEHTSELQSHLNLVCRLLLEKKNSRHHHQ